MDPFNTSPPVVPGNIDIMNRMPVDLPGGRKATVRSMSFRDDDGLETLIPTIVGGKVLSPNEAIKHYRASKEHLGKFKGIVDADNYAEWLHRQQEEMLGGSGGPFGR